MQDLIEVLYDYTMENRMNDFLDMHEYRRINRLCALEEEKLVSLLHSDYKQLFNDYFDHLMVRQGMETGAVFRSALSLCLDFPGKLCPHAPMAPMGGI